MYIELRTIFVFLKKTRTRKQINITYVIFATEILNLSYIHNFVLRIQHKTKLLGTRRVNLIIFFSLEQTCPRFFISVFFFVFSSLPQQNDEAAHRRLKATIFLLAKRHLPSGELKREKTSTIFISVCCGPYLSSRSCNFKSRPSTSPFTASRNPWGPRTSDCSNKLEPNYGYRR